MWNNTFDSSLKSLWIFFVLGNTVGETFDDGGNLLLYVIVLNCLDISHAGLSCISVWLLIASCVCHLIFQPHSLLFV